MLKASQAIVLIAFCLLLAPLSHAKDPGESDFIAAKVLGTEFADWIRKLEPRPRTMGIFWVNVNPPMEPHYGEVVESEIIAALRAPKIVEVLSCPDCRTPKIEVRGDRLAVKKGIPEIKVFQEMGKQYGVDSFVLIDLYRTKLSVIAQASLYEASTGKILASESFKIAALDFSDAARQVLFTIGPAFVAGGNEGGDSRDLAFIGNVSVLEEVGFGKGGVTVGGVTSSSKGTLGYVLPTIGWRGRFGASYMYSLTSVGLGYGITNKTTGIGARAAYDLFIGSFTNVGVELVGLVPMQREGEDTQKPIGAVFSLHIGFALGR